MSYDTLRSWLVLHGSATAIARNNFLTGDRPVEHLWYGPIPEPALQCGTLEPTTWVPWDELSEDDDVNEDADYVENAKACVGPDGRFFALAGQQRKFRDFNNRPIRRRPYVYDPDVALILNQGLDFNVELPPAEFARKELPDYVLIKGQPGEDADHSDPRHFNDLPRAVETVEQHQQKQDNRKIILPKAKRPFRRDNRIYGSTREQRRGR